MFDIKLVKKDNNHLDFSFNGADFVSTDNMYDIVEGLLFILLLSSYKPSIGFGVDLKSFRGSRVLNNVLPIILYRIVYSWGFYSNFIDNLPSLSITDIKNRGDKIKFNIKFEEGLEVEGKI